MGRVVPAIALLALLVLLGALAWHWRADARQQARVATEIAALRSEHEALRAALRSTQGALDGVQQAQTRMLQQLDQPGDAPADAALRADLAAVASIRVAVAEYYLVNGHMPAHQTDAGLPAPDAYRGRSLRSATVEPDGSIDLLFDDASGVAGGRIRYVADTSHAVAMGVQWRCETRDYPQIGRIVPACRYMARPAAVSRP